MMLTIFFTTIQPFLKCLHSSIAYLFLVLHYGFDDPGRANNTADSRYEAENEIQPLRNNDLLLPKRRISGSSLYRASWKEAFITIMDRIVSLKSRSDEKLRIYDPILTMLYVIQREGIHMMNQQSMMYLVPRNSKITAIVT